MIHTFQSLFFLSLLFQNQLSAQEPLDATVLDVGSKRQLFIDDYLIDHSQGDADLDLHHPVPQEVAIVFDEPWEGNASGYHTVFQDGDIYRMYYRGWQIDIDSVNNKIHGSTFYYCYAESPDGINWTKPDLGLYEFNGSKKNNIILATTKFGDLSLEMGDNASFFKDENPDAAPDAQYKGFVFSRDPRGLIAIKSGDGIHWEPMSEQPVLTDGAFDSQNVGFWDSEIGAYRAYWRYFEKFIDRNNKNSFRGIRAIRTATSKDFIHWENQNDLKYENSPHEELYTNQVFPYYRAPQILIGLPARYVERGWSYSMEQLPENDHRKLRSRVSNRYGMALSDGLLMSSRDGVLFDRWNKAFFPPGIERPGTWNYAHHFIAHGILQTESHLEGAPDELSFYSTEGYWTGNSNQLRRYTLRMDGFVSVSAPANGGEIVTKPFKFNGDRLFVNFSTSSAGTIKIEVQDAHGQAIPGFTLKECPEIFGDNLHREIVWDRDLIPGDLLSQTIRLRVVLEDADLYSFKFE